MKVPRRQFLHLAAGAGILPGVSRVAKAQAYPAKPVRIICGFPPGGINDIYARLIGQWLSDRLREGTSLGLGFCIMCGAQVDGAALPNTGKSTL
jgi:hypothetical protein